MDGLRHKGIPLGVTVDADAVGAAGWVVSAGDTATPVATLSVEPLERNAAAMAAWCEGAGVSLAPHAKTSLSPELLDLQARHGAWAMTAALPRQAALVWAQGIDRVVIANEVTDPVAVQWLSAQLDADADRRLWLYADSVPAVDRLVSALAGRAAERPVDVLVELGHPGGRTGARDLATAQAVAGAVRAAPTLRLAGVAAYEGTIGADRTAQPAVDAFLTAVGELVGQIGAPGGFEVAEPLVTAGGSVWFDRVAALLGPPTASVGGRLAVRSGCYLFHDHGLYAAGTPAAAHVPEAPVFEPALTVWARVLSRPEPELVLVDAGRRDLSHDAGLPVPLSAHRVADRETAGPGTDLVAAGASVTGLSDQHAFVQLPAGLDVQVGDLVRLGISHPCTTLDRWPVILLVDERHTVTGAVRTQF